MLALLLGRGLGLYGPFVRLVVYVVYIRGVCTCIRTRALGLPLLRNVLLLYPRSRRREPGLAFCHEG